ncbi:PXA domain-containing protein [Chlamydoabsidia padenii]|nr:PXA domain-containing protein [Chlamydoabsidia padenii]
MSGSDVEGTLQRYIGLKDDTIRGIFWSPVVLGLTVVIYALSHTANGLLFSYAIAAASVFGVLYFSNSHPPQQVFTQQRYSLSSIWTDNDDTKLELDEQSTKLDLFYPPLTKSVDQLLRYFYRDFVHSWWNPLQSGYDDEFEQTIKVRLNAAVTNIEKTLLKQERNDIVMAIMYGLANTLIIHMRECRTFEMSEQPMDIYIVENPQSPFAQLLSKKEQHDQLRGLCKTILKRILPVADMNSHVVNCLLKELLATHLFGNILATCSDPDFINGWIVQYLAGSDHLASSDTTTLTEADGLRSLVEKATEDAMAAEQQLQQTSDIEHHDNNITDNTNDSTQDRDDISLETHIQPSTTPEPTRSQPPQMNEQVSSLSGRPPSLHSVDDSKRRMTLSKADEVMLQSPMIYAYGTVSFSIMDISPPQDMDNVDKSSLMFIIQIERPALQESSGSEGGGYVITRTYHDFDIFQSLMRAKHAKRVARLNLRLPLDVTRSWLLRKKRTATAGTTATSIPNGGGNDNEVISHGLEHYLNTVVGDAELGRDPLILAFLRKERATEHGTTQKELPFAEEYKDELVATTTPLAVDTSTSIGGRAMSLFGRSSISNGSTPTTTTTTAAASPSLSSSIGSLLSQDESTDLTKPQHEKVTRQGSISSTKSDSDSQGDDTPDPPKDTSFEAPQQKPLSAMDTELLIETTFALIVEIFDLTTANNKAWMRRSLLNVLREIVRRSYTELVAKQYNHYIQAYLSPHALVGWMDLIKDKFWPSGVFAGGGHIHRTEEEKKQTEQLAKQLLVQRAIPGGVRQLIGDQNSTLAMERIWTRLQDQDLNRVLVLQVLERVIRPLFG